MKKIPVYQPSLSGNEKKYVLDCLDTGWISSKGAYIKKFETAFAEYIGGEHATTVSNGTVALHVALLALGLKPGDEIIVPTLTYVASVNAIKYVDAIPIFVDSCINSWQIDVTAIADKITPKTRAIMAVHLYGHPCDMEPLRALAQRHNLFIIEDAAEALGSLYKRQHVGTFGDIATFSFYGNKTITTGEGGMVVCHNDEIYQRVCHLKNQAVDPNIPFWHDYVGYNYRMTNICAAIGLAQLEQADYFLNRKREIADYYRSHLQSLPLKDHGEVGEVHHSYWMYSIILNDATKRDALRDHLAQSGIETRPIFYPAHTLPMFVGYTDEVFPVATKISAASLNLPSWPDLQDEDLDYICNEISTFFE